jgi:hypothetical protein
MNKKKVIFDETQKRDQPIIVDEVSDDYILDSLWKAPHKESLENVSVPPDQKALRQKQQPFHAPLLSKEDVKKAQKEAQEEAIKNEEKARQTMERIIGTAPRVLFSCRGVFPFDFFPNEITIEETRVNIIERKFWGTAEIKAVGIPDITEVAVNTTIFFATLSIGSRTFINNFVEIHFLWKKDAMKARRIIEGLRILSSQRVNLSALELSQLVAKVEEIGAIQKPRVQL